MNPNQIAPLPAYARIPFRLSKKMAVVSLLATGLCTGAALAAPGGELDATFGENGRLTIQEASLGGVVLQQPDGKLLVLESVEAMIRFNDGGLSLIGRVVAVRGNASGIPTEGVPTVRVGISP